MALTISTGRPPAYPAQAAIRAGLCAGPATPAGGPPGEQSVSGWRP